VADDGLQVKFFVAVAAGEMGILDGTAPAATAEIDAVGGRRALQNGNDVAFRVKSRQQVCMIIAIRRRENLGDTPPSPCQSPRIGSALKGTVTAGFSTFLPLFAGAAGGVVCGVSAPSSGNVMAQSAAMCLMLFIFLVCVE
jgi:hypothetical protein